MRLTGFERFTLLPVAVLAFAASTSARAQKETENVDRTVAFPAGGTLELHNFSGDVHITGTSGKDIIVKAVRRADRDRLDHIKLDIRTSGSTVSIEANKRDSDWTEHNNNVVETTFEIQVPATAKLDIDVFSSDLDIKGVTGAERLKTFSGTITVDATAAGASPNLTAETFSGGIRAKLADSAKGDVSFDSFSGNLDTDLPLTMHSAGRRRFSGTLPGGSAGSTLSFHTFSGNVHVTK
jgi:DUF4097 and DUF4098 domain-containing protein YvlB